MKTPDEIREKIDRLKKEFDQLYFCNSTGIWRRSIVDRFEEDAL